MNSRRLVLSAAVALVMTPWLTGARGNCGAVDSTDPAPRVAGVWGVTYDDTFDVQIVLGGAVYDATLPSSGGAVTIDHEGTPISFMLDCSRPEVVCPSEVWPAMVTIDQRDEEFQHRMWVAIPRQACMGTERRPLPSECGAETTNPDCLDICDGEVSTVTRDAFGLIAEGGASFDLLLGAGVATNGVNCALLGISSAHANLSNVGSAATEDWESVAMEAGTIRTAYAGGCLWAGDPDMDEELEALVIAASVDIRTGFTAARAE